MRANKRELKVAVLLQKCTDYLHFLTLFLLQELQPHRVFHKLGIYSFVFCRLKMIGWGSNQGGFKSGWVRIHSFFPKLNSMIV